MVKHLHFKFIFLLCALMAVSAKVGAVDVKYQVQSVSKVEKTLGTAPTGSSASYSQTYGTVSQATANNSFTLTLSGYNGYKITKLVLSMKSNSKGGAGKLSYSTDGGSTFSYLVGSSSSGVAFNQADWHGSWSTSYVDVVKDNLNIICDESDVVFKVEATANSLYCQSYTFTYEAIPTGPQNLTSFAFANATPSVELTKGIGSYDTSFTQSISFSPSTYTGTVTYSIDFENSTITADEAGINSSTGEVTIMRENNVGGTLVVVASGTAVTDKFNAPDDATYTLTVNPYKPSAPILSVATGAVDYGTTLNMSAAEGTTIRYTLDGTTPTASTGELYSSALTIKDAWNVRAVAVDGSFVSDAASADYTINAPAIVTLTPAGGNSSNKTSVQYGTQVTMSHPMESMGTIRYTTNGTIPANQIGEHPDKVFAYTEPITIVADVRIKPQFQTDNGLYWSASAPDNYFVVETPAAPTASPLSGEVEQNTTVTLSHVLASTLGDIYYTTDGTDPSNSSTKYTVPIAIDTDKTIKARFITNGGHLGEIATFEYTYFREDAGLAFSETSYTVTVNSTFTEPTLTKPEGLAVTYTSSAPTIASVDSETGEVTIHDLEGDAIIYARSEKNATYYADEASYTITVYDPSIKGSQWNPYMATEALEEAEKLGYNEYSEDVVYVRGIVSSTTGTRGNYYISDDGTTTSQFYIYGGKFTSSTTFNSSNDVTVGDVVTICGKLYNYKGNTPEMASGNYLYSITRRTAPGISFETSSYSTHPNDTEFETPTLVNPNNLTGIIYESSNPDVAAVNSTDGTVIIGAEEGNATITALYLSSIESNYKRGTASYTITVARAEAGFSFSASTETITKGETLTTTFNNPNNLPNITFGSSFSDVAFVNASGVLTLGSSTGTAILTATSPQTDLYKAGEATCTITVNPSVIVVEPNPTGYYEKVTSTSGLIDGAKYLFVNEDASKALNGANLVDGTSNVIVITIDGGHIASSNTVDDAAFTYNSSNQSFKSSQNKYLKGGNKSISGSESVESNTISFDEPGNVQLYNSSSYLRYNTDGPRFRYYTSLSSCVDVQLYKFVPGESPATINIQVSEAGLATYASNFDLDFTEVAGLEAYIATAGVSTITLIKKNVIPAGEGMLLRATDGGGKNYIVSTTTASEDDKTAVSGNLLKRGTGGAVATDAGGGKTNYILNVVDNQIGFYRANGMTVATNRAYLQTTGAAARIAISFEDANGICEDKLDIVTSNRYYNLHGQCVDAPLKGLYIVNGKKVMVK